MVMKMAVVRMNNCREDGGGDDDEDAVRDDGADKR